MVVATARGDRRGKHMRVTGMLSRSEIGLGQFGPSRNSAIALVGHLAARVLLFGVAFFTILPDTADALSSTDARCLKATILGSDRVAKAQDRHQAGCVADALAGKVASPELCIRAEGVRRVDFVFDRVRRDDLRYCSAPPVFGYASSEIVTSRTREAWIDLIDDLFGPDIDSILTSSTQVDAACQRSVSRMLTKMKKARFKLFRSCIQSSIRGKRLNSDADLERCLFLVAADERGKIARGREKLDRTLSKHCALADLSAVFPGKCIAAGAEFSTCVDQRLACHTCRALSASTAGDFACDLFDNGAADDSCRRSFPQTPLVVAGETLTHITLAWSALGSDTDLELQRRTASCVGPACWTVVDNFPDISLGFSDAGWTSGELGLRYPTDYSSPGILQHGESYIYRLRGERVDGATAENFYSNEVTAELRLTEGVRGVAGDSWADAVLFQDDFRQNNIGIPMEEALAVFGGVTIYGTGGQNYIFIVDAVSNRVKVFVALGRCSVGSATCMTDGDCGPGDTCLYDFEDLSFFSDHAHPLVIGQSQAHGGACNGDNTGVGYPHLDDALKPNDSLAKIARPTASTLCTGRGFGLSPAETVTVTSPWIDSAGNLWLVDPYNHRLLFYSDVFHTDNVADQVFGQLGSFETNRCHTIGSGGYCLNDLVNVALDPHEEFMAVPNEFHDRVLIYRNGATTPSGFTDVPDQELDVVRPRVVTFDADRAMYVVSFGMRTSIYKYELAQSGLFYDGVPTASVTLVSPVDWDHMNAIIYDELRDRLWLSDATSHQVITVKTDLSDEMSFGAGPSPRGLTLAADGTLLIASAGGFDALMAVGPDEVDDFISGGGAPTRKNVMESGSERSQRGARGLSGVAVYENAETGNVLVSTDTQKVSFWPDMNPDTVTNGRAPFVWPNAASQIEFSLFSSPVIVGQDLWFSSRRELFNACGGESQRGAIRRLSLSNATFDDQSYTGAIDQVICLPDVLMADGRIGHTLTSPVQDFIKMAGDPTDSTRLWVALENHGIVARMKDIHTDPKFDFVIGKTSGQLDDALTDPGALKCDSVADTGLGALNYCLAYDIATDPVGNLYVTEKQVSQDGTDTQIFVYPNTLFASTLPGETVYLSDIVPDPIAAGIITLGTGDPTDLFAESNCSTDDGCHPFTPGFNGEGQVVVGGNGYLRGGIPSPAMVYLDIERYPFPTVALGDAYAQLMSGVFDQHGNFYAADWNYNRILIYRGLNAWLDPNGWLGQNSD